MPPSLPGRIGSGPSHRAILRKLSVQVGKLKVVTYPKCDQWVNHAAGDMLDLHMPLLKYLGVRGFTDSAAKFRIQAGNVPALQVLELMALDAWISAPLPSVIGFRYDPIDSRYYEPDIFSYFPNLQHLALHIRGVPSISVVETSLPRLISLEVQWMTQQSIDQVLRFFGTFWLPSLQSLTLHNEFYDHEDYPKLLKSLVCTQSPKCHNHRIDV